MWSDWTGAVTGTGKWGTTEPTGRRAGPLDDLWPHLGCDGMLSFEASHRHRCICSYFLFALFWTIDNLESVDVGLLCRCDPHDVPLVRLFAGEIECLKD
jgi:hypothetical protein